MRVLIDTNCLLMISPKSSKHYWLMQAVQNGVIEVVVTTEILSEYEEIMGRYYSPEYVQMLIG